VSLYFTLPTHNDNKITPPKLRKIMSRFYGFASGYFWNTCV